MLRKCYVCLKSICYVNVTMQKETKYVVRGELRKEVLFNLIAPSTPTFLAKKLNRDRPSVSRSILFLLNKSMVICLNPKDKRGRLYQISPLGKLVLTDLKKMGVTNG